MARAKTGAARVFSRIRLSHAFFCLLLAAAAGAAEAYRLRPGVPMHTDIELLAGAGIVVGVMLVGLRALLSRPLSRGLYLAIAEGRFRKGDGGNGDDETQVARAVHRGRLVAWSLVVVAGLFNVGAYATCGREMNRLFALALLAWLLLELPRPKRFEAKVAGGVLEVRRVREQERQGQASG